MYSVAKLLSFLVPVYFTSASFRIEILVFRIRMCDVTLRVVVRENRAKC